MRAIFQRNVFLLENENSSTLHYLLAFFLTLTLILIHAFEIYNIKTEIESEIYCHDNIYNFT